MMKSDIFRSVTFWKSAIMTMPDNSFYELVRSVFGKIKTPFNKQKLINDLGSFLLRADIQKTIAAYIDQTDEKIIAAAALLNEPLPEQLESFFIDELSAARLQDIIVNLEERFILYRVQESRLALNPVLKNILLPVTENTSVLFPAIPVNKTSSSKKKKQINLLKMVLEQTAEFPAPALQILGLYYIDDNSLVPDEKRLNSFNLLEVSEQNEQIAAALLVYKTDTPASEILPPLYRSKIRETANLIHSFLESLKTEYQYQDAALKRKIDVLKAQTGVNIKTDDMLEILKKTSLIRKTKAPAVNSASENSDSKQLKKITAKFHSLLEKMSASEAEKTELSARIDRRLVLCESQLKDAEVRYEKLEARLMDYTGKQIIAKQAVAAASPVEIIRQHRGKEKQIFGIPNSLEKKGDALFLLIAGKRIPLAKIILIRKIKKSIFEV